MQPIFPRISKSTLIEAALGIILLHAPLLCEDGVEEDAIGALFSSGKVKKTSPSQFSDDQVLHNTPSLKELDKKKDTYTINFNNISITEYIRFASKITNLNFVFNDSELQFNVTVVSEEPVTPRNIMSILIQVLRINGLVVLEQDNNLLITKVRSVSQLATVVASDLPEATGNSPLVTRVFRIKNANLNTIASVIKPMMSDSALLEISAETKQMIITDITTNVDKISSLLASIDAPHSSLEIDSYVAKNLDLDSLIKLATQIITPFSEGNPLTFVPQTESRTIFIISTPFLIERAMTVLEDLDTSDKIAMSGQSVYLYKLEHKRGDDFLSALHDLSKQLQKRDAPDNLINTLDQAKWIKESNSILFIGDNQTLAKVKELIPMLDTSTREGTFDQKSNFYVYKIQQAPYEQLENSLDLMAENLQKAPQPDYALIDVLTSVKYIPDANSLIFTGDTAALSKLAEILPSFDVASPQAQLAPSQFLVYNPKNLSGEELEKTLKDIAISLKNAGLADPLFLQSVKTAKWTPSNNTLIFTGTPDTLSRIQTLLVSLDGGEAVSGGVGGQTFYLYKLQSAMGSTVIDSLKKVSSNLNDSNVPNQALISTLRNVKWIKDNNSLLLTGNSAAIDQARTLIAQFDIAAAVTTNPEFNKSAFYIYKPVHQKPQVLQAYIRDMAKDLEGSGLIDPDLLLTLNTMRYVDSTNSLLFTGTPAALEKVKEILARTDTVTQQEAQIQQLGQSTFLIYKVQYVPATQLISSLKNLTSDLQKTGAIDQGVVDSINGLKYIKDTNSILFTGTEPTLTKIEAMLKKFDSASLAPHADGTAPAPSTFIVYTPKYIPGDDLIKILDDFQQNLVASGVANKSLFDTISNLKYVSRTCSLIISGTQESIAKVEELLRRFDVPTSEPTKIAPSIESIQNTSFLIYKLQYHQGDEILSALKQIATDLGTGTATGNQNLLSAINSLQWIRVTNSLLSSGEAETLSKLRDLITNLDIPLRQVFIDILVIETSLNSGQNFGLQWGGKMQYLNKFAAGSGNFPSSSTNSTNNPNGGVATPQLQPGINATNATTFPNPNGPNGTGIPFVNGFDLGVIGDIIMHKGRSFISLGSLVNALQIDNDSTVIMNPKIITQDNRTSTIFVGTNVPFIGSQVTTSATIVSSSSNIEYRDIGFNLTITPTIGNSDIVTLDISNDISDIVSSQTSIGSSNVSGSTNNIVGITSTHTSMTTRVHVPDQHFVVLSGMIQDTKTRYKSSIPCLGGLPVIGAIFSESDRANTKSNIIIFMRPHIVNTYEDYKAITDEQENLYKDVAVLPVLKEEFDAGVDMVKKAEDE